jgi:hypothetical protein
MAEFSGMAAQARRNGVPAPGTTVAERVLGTGQQLPQGGYGGSETEAEFQSFGPADSADDSPAPKPRPVSYDGERFVQAAPAPVQAPSAKPQCTCGWQKDVWHNTARIWGYDPGCGAALLRPSVFDKRPDFAGVPFFFCRLGPDSKTIAPIGGRFYFALPGRGEDVALTGEDEMCREVPGVHGDYGHIFSDSTNLHVGDVVVVYTGLPDRGGRPIVKFTVESGKGYWLVLPCDEQGNPVK